MDFDHRKIALVLARARAVNGLVLLVLPGVVGRVLYGKAGSQPAARALLRLIGVRDLVLGIGAITTLKEHTMDAEWVGMGAAADAVDGLVSLATPGLLASDAASCRSWAAAPQRRTARVAEARRRARARAFRNRFLKARESSRGRG